jgi:proteasome lid subunit RPN8/RPN11
VTAISEIPGLDGPVRDQVDTHVFSNADREVGGVLVGRTSQEQSAPVVTAAIAAASASERRSTLTFTQDTWEHVHRILERDHPDQQIVGWYHSHPGFGIFLSEHDLFIHRNFFSGASQIALVVDPLQGQEGVFGWQGDEIAMWYQRATARPALGEARAPLESAAVRPSPGVGPPVEATVVLKGRPLPAPSARPAVYLACALIIGVLLGLVLWEAVLRDDGASAPPAQERTHLPGPPTPGVVPNEIGPATEREAR